MTTKLNDGTELARSILVDATDLDRAIEVADAIRDAASILGRVASERDMQRMHRARSHEAKQAGDLLRRQRTTALS